MKIIVYLKYLFHWATGLDPRIIPVLLYRENRKKVISNKTCIFYGNHNKNFFLKKIYGGKVKLFYLKNVFPENADSEILYLVSSALPSGWIWTLLYFKLTKRIIVLNQNGVYYPDILPFFYSLANISNKIIYKYADHIIYQSRFCKKMAEKYLSLKKVQYTILNNPAINYKISQKIRKRFSNISLMGNQYEKYRLERALATALILVRKNIKFNLKIYGCLNWTFDTKNNKKSLIKEIKQKNLQSHVKYLGPYKRKELPNILKTTDLLLHTKSLDPCPSSVVEAIRNGIPVVYIKDGGTSELVGPGGIGVTPRKEKTLSCYTLEKNLAEAISAVIKERSKFSKLAQKHGEKFSIEHWISIHTKIFEKIKNKK